MLDSDEEGSRKVPSDVIRNLRRNNNRRNRPRTAFNFSPHSISAKFHLGTIGENDFIRNCKFVERLDYQNGILFRICCAIKERASPGSSCGATALSHSIFHAIAKSRANIATTPVIHTHLFPEPDFKTSGILVIIVCDVEIQIEFDFQSVRQFDFPRIGITVDLADKLTGVVHLRYEIRDLLGNDRRRNGRIFTIDRRPLTVGTEFHFRAVGISHLIFRTEVFALLNRISYGQILEIRSEKFLRGFRKVVDRNRFLASVGLGRHDACKQQCHC